MTAEPAPGGARRRDLDAALRHVRERIAAAARAADRPVADLTLVVVTKTWPVADLAELVRLGVREVGENRDDEASGKRHDAEPPWPRDLRWHMVGQVQSRKAASVAGWADVVHSVDREKLVGALSRGVERARDSGVRAPGWELECFAQVCLDPDPRRDPGRGGAAIDDLPALMDAVAAAPGLRPVGVMAVPPQAGEPERWFAALEEIAAVVRRDHPGARGISAGMSGDLEVAVRHGATHLRVGTAILGRRPARG